MNQPKLLRRTFLQHLGAAGAGTLAATASTPGSGESPGLKALVCVYLEGGNDSANMLIPCDPAEHAAYTAARPRLALPLSPQREAPWHVLPLTGAARSAGIHSAMPELRDLFAAGRVSFMANTGPRSANQHGSPTRTGSHRDQSTQWQTGDSDGICATGWAGRMAHVLQKRMPVKTASTEPDAVWLAGAGEVKTLSQENTLADFPGCHFSPLLRNGPAMHGLATQLQAVARDISTGSAGSRFYFVRMPGFDTHSDQSKTHATLLRALSAGIAAFASSMSALGMADQVTLFTMSDLAARCTARRTAPTTAGAETASFSAVHCLAG